MLWNEVREIAELLGLKPTTLLSCIKIMGIVKSD
jgi:hypothetical protein